MWKWGVILILAAPSLAQTGSLYSRFVHAIDAGDPPNTPQRLKPEIAKGFAKRDWELASLLRSVRDYCEGPGRKDDQDSAAKLVEFLQVVGASAEKNSLEPDRFQWVAARCKLVQARWQHQNGEPDWLKTWRDAANLCQAEDAPDAARTAAIGILMEAALMKGAPVDEIVEDARKLVPEGAEQKLDSRKALPYLAFQLGLAEVCVRIKKKKSEAKIALAPFETLDGLLRAGKPDLDLATIYNDAADFAAGSRVRVKVPFLTRELVESHLTWALPISRRWLFAQWGRKGSTNKFGFRLYQFTRDGLLRRSLIVFNMPEDAPSADGRLRQDSDVARVKDWSAAIRLALVKFKRDGRAKRGRWCKGLPAGAIVESAGWTAGGGFQTHRYFCFRGKRLAESFGTILCVAYGNDPEDDADAQAFLASVKDQ